MEATIFTERWETIMSLEKLISLVSRLFFLCAFVLLGLALIERIANATGYTILQVYRGSRLLEVAVVLLVFVIAAQLREMKAELKRTRV
jgi:hypothetical protein